MSKDLSCNKKHLVKKLAELFPKINPECINQIYPKLEDIIANWHKYEPILRTKGIEFHESADPSIESSTCSETSSAASKSSISRNGTDRKSHPTINLRCQDDIKSILSVEINAGMIASRQANVLGAKLNAQVTYAKIIEEVRQHWQVASPAGKKAGFTMGRVGRGNGKTTIRCIKKKRDIDDVFSKKNIDQP